MDPPTRHGPRQFGGPSSKPVAVVPAVQTLEEKPPREKKPKAKVDPKFLTANRELRDRYLEQLNTHDVAGCGKYDVSRALPEAAGVGSERAMPLLEAA